MDTELTIRDISSDPLIAMIMRADGVERQVLAELMNRTAKVQVELLQTQIRQARANDFYTRLDLGLARSKNAPFAR